MGAVALTNVRTGVTHDGRRMKEATVEFSGSYATGGDTIPLTSLGLSEVRRIEILSQPALGWAVEPVVTDPKAPKLKLNRRTDAGALVEATNAGSNSGQTARLRFIGS